MPGVSATTKVSNVEVLRPGVWNGVPISRRDLEDVVAAWTETRDALPVTVRLGHDAKQAFAKAVFGDDAAADDAQGWPSLGEPERLYLDGDVLKADLEGVPTRLADAMRNKRYRTRSAGLRHNRTVNGKVYRWSLDHIALLGAETPAVDGLADIGLSATDQDRAVDAVFEASDADGWLALAAGDSALDVLLAKLDSALTEYEAFVAKRKGAPMVRQLFAAAMGKLRESARSELPPTTGETNMAWSLEAVRGLLNLNADADAPTVVGALNGAGEDVAGQLVKLAEGYAFETAEQLVGWLAGALAVAPNDLGGIAAKVVGLMGGDAPDAPTEGPTAPSEGEAPMATNDAGVSTVGVSAQVVELSTIVTKQGSEIVELRSELARRDARERVETDARGKGLSLPKPVFDTLVDLAMARNETAYAAILDNTRGVPVGEVGTSEGVASVELTATDKTVARSLGMTDEQFLAQKTADAAARGF